MDCWVEVRRLRLLLVGTDCPPLVSPTLPPAVKNLGFLVSEIGQGPPQPRCVHNLVGVAHDCAVVADAGSTHEIREVAGIHHVFGIDRILEPQWVNVCGPRRDMKADRLWDVALAIGVLRTTVDQTDVGVVQVLLEPFWLNEQVVSRVPLLLGQRHLFFPPLPGRDRDTRLAPLRVSGNPTNNVPENVNLAQSARTSPCATAHAAIAFREPRPNAYRQDRQRCNQPVAAQGSRPGWPEEGYR